MSNQYENIRYNIQLTAEIFLTIYSQFVICCKLKKCPILRSLYPLICNPDPINLYAGKCTQKIIHMP